MTSIRSLERGIRDAFSLIKNDMVILKNSFLTQKDKNTGIEKKIDVLDNRIENLSGDIENLRDNIKELGSTKEDIGEIHDLKKEIESLRKEIGGVKKNIGKKIKKDVVEEIKETGETVKRDNLVVVFWVLLIALIIVVSFGLYYDLYGIFGSEVNGGYFKVFNIEEGGLVKLDIIASDKDNDNLFITYGGPLDSKGEWQTKEGDAGEYEVTITVSDGKDTVSENVKIVVE